MSFRYVSVLGFSSWLWYLVADIMVPQVTIKLCVFRLLSRCPKLQLSQRKPEAERPGTKSNRGSNWDNLEPKLKRYTGGSRSQRSTAAERNTVQRSTECCKMSPPTKPGGGSGKNPLFQIAKNSNFQISNSKNPPNNNKICH